MIRKRKSLVWAWLDARGGALQTEARGGGTVDDLTIWRDEASVSEFSSVSPLHTPELAVTGPTWARPC